MDDSTTIQAGIALLGILVPTIGGLLGIKWQQAKGQLKDAVHQTELIVMKASQAHKVLKTMSEALEDDKITTTEAKIIANQIKQLVSGMEEST